MITNKIEFSGEFLVKGFNEALKLEAERLFEEAKKNAIAEFDRRKAEIIAGLLLTITKRTDMQILQDRVVFTIEDKNDQTK